MSIRVTDAADAVADIVSLQIFRNLFSSLAEEMGIILRRAAFSPNIKMRLDFSCAVFDKQGQLLAQAAHIPVHLGAMSMAMRSVLAQTSLDPGDVVILNDPFAGGTHLPDISLISAAYSHSRLLGYVMSRAHHSDVGGMSPASMPLATDISQEGIVIPAIKLVTAGTVQADILALIERNVRTPEERRGDLLAQLAAQTAGEHRFLSIASRYGHEEVEGQAKALIGYSEGMTRSLLSSLSAGTAQAEDYLDDDGFGGGRVKIRVHADLTHDGLTLDFRESDDQRDGPINAVEAVTRSATLYVLRTIMAEDVPVNDGMMKPVRILTNKGSVVDAASPAAVSSGNVETSQRIVDVLFRVFAELGAATPAASQGTMNNIAFGGFDPARARRFAYYETLGGGMGARAHVSGMSGMHDHMSNTMNTPVEVLESQYPVRVRRYALRHNSGGAGMSRGGEGIIRELEFLSPARGTIMSDRRLSSPYGLNGGSPGMPGHNTVVRDGRNHDLPGKAMLDLQAGDILVIETPGGGGYGSPNAAEQ